MARLLRFLLSPLLVSGLVAPAGSGDCPVPSPADHAMNLIVEVNCDLASAAASQNKTTPETVDEVIVGARVEGHGISLAVTGLEFIPDDHKGSAELVLQSTLLTQTAATKGPSTTFNSNASAIKARKPVWLTCDGISWAPAYSGVHMETRLEGVAVKPKGLVGEITRKLTLLMYERDKQKAREESEFKTGVKTMDRFDEEAGKDLIKRNQDFHDRMQRLAKKNLIGKSLLFRTTPNLLIAMMRLVDESEPPSLLPPPPVQGLPALAVRVHESLLDTAATRMYAGQTRDRAGFRQDMKDLGLDQEDSKEKPEPEEDFEITFARKEPITATFADQHIKVTLRSTRFKQGDGTVYERPWQTTLTYRLSMRAGGFRLEREGEIDPVPLDPATMKPTEMTGPRIVERRALIRLLGRNFRKEYTLDEIKPTGDMKKIGTLESAQGEASNGWLLLAWKRNPLGQ